MKLPTSICLALLVAGCSSQQVEPTTPVAEPVEVVAEQPEAPTPAEELAEAVKLIDKGDHDAALAALEGLLAAHPELDDVWGYVFQEAVAAGKAGEFLDRLSVTDAIGGRSLEHHTLRAELALAAQRPTDIMDASAAIKSEDTAAAMAYQALAVRSGATQDPDGLDATLPGDALTLAVIAEDPKDIAAHLEVAKAVDSWRATLLRADLLLSIQQQDEALATLDSIGDDAPIAARLEATDMRLHTLTAPDEIARQCIEAADLALQRHHSAMAVEYLTDATEAYLQATSIDDALTTIRERHDAFKAAGGLNAQRLATIHAEAALEAGEFEEAAETTAEALAALGDGPADLRADLARIQARAGYATCDLQLLADAREALPAPESSVVEGLEALCRGDKKLARGMLATGDIPESMAFTIAMAAIQAYFGLPASVPAAQDAVAMADAWGRLPARLEARLAWERAARVVGDTRSRKAAMDSFQALPTTPALELELYAREMASGTAARPFPGVPEGVPESIAGWAAFDDPAAVQGDEAPTGLAAWAVARNLLKAHDFEGAFEQLNTAFPALPSRLQGRWAPILAMVGADGPSLAPDFASLAGQDSEDSVQVRLALHEWYRFQAMARLAAQIGDDLSFGLPEDAAKVFKTSTATRRQRSLLWLAGAAPYPKQAAEAVAAVIEEHPFMKGQGPAPSLETLRSSFEETAIISIHLGNKSGEIALVTPTASQVHVIPNAPAFRAAVSGYRDALLKGMAFTRTRTDPRNGDRIRSAVLDPIANNLQGIARYLFVADPDLMMVPWFTLPEQVEGRRYLADIRSISAAPLISLLLLDFSAPEDGYKPDFFGAGQELFDDEDSDAFALPDDEVSRTMKAAGLKNPGELTTIARLFGGDFSDVFKDEDSTKANWQQSASTARYVHLCGVPAAPTGGLAWIDGDTSPSELRASRVHARLVTLSHSESPEIQLVRSQALMEAGAHGVLVAVWDILPSLRTRYLSAFYNALNRDRAPSRALAEAREVLGSDALQTAEQYSDPSYWGGFLLVGAP